MSLAPKELQAIKRRLRLAENHNKKNLKEKFERAIRLFTGDHYEDSANPSNRSRIVVNYCLHVEETKVHSVAFRYPEFVLKPHSPEAAGYEDLAKAAIQCEWRHGKVQAEMKKGWKDREIYGTGIVYTGWLFTTDDGARMEDGRRMTDADQSQDTTPNPSDAWGMVPAQTVREDHFLAKRIYPGNFLVSPEAGCDLEEADYCGYVEVRSLEEVKANPRFKNTKQLKGSTNNLRQWFDAEMVKEYCSEDAESQDKVPADIKRVKLSHYFEKSRRLHLVMCDEHEKPLLEEAWSWEHDRYPFRVRQNVGDTDEFWGIPGPLLIEHQQKELNEARSQLSDHRRRAVPKYSAMIGTLSTAAQDVLKSADSGEVVFHTSSEQDPVRPIPPLQLQPEVYNTETQVVADIQTIMGISQYEVGQAPTKRITGAEVDAIQQRGGARAKNDLQEFETWCAEVATDCLAWMKMYSVKTRQIPIYDMEGTFQQWRDFSREEIRGEYDIEVYANSTTPPSNEDNIQAIGFLVQSLNPLIQLALPAQQLGMDLLPLIRQLLKSIPDIRNVDKILPPVPPMGAMAPPMAGGMGVQPDPGLAGGGDMAGAVPGQVPFAPVDDRKLPPDLLALLQGAGQQGY
jgi:hypothetical protein